CRLEEDGGDQITKFSVSSIQAASIWETTPLCVETAVDPVGEGAEAIPQVDCAARPVYRRESQ
ncbi:hypothetical protein, partial [Aeromonas allosaccharophila]|uniref:hypothetical protein n=1 Tax=Aeromonas allosaccharophila TaxID=656 RepID=UPI0030043B59